jgi:fucose 4-O-acetylase-like acetyltransferase
MNQPINSNQRDLYFDYLRGIPILLVVLGHCIQYGSGAAFFNNEAYFDNVVFKLIYSIHMPLFMCISGYFFYFTINKKTTLSVIKSKFIRIILPVIAWNLIVVIYFVFKRGIYQCVCVDFISACFSKMWFLWAVFWCSMVVLLVNKLLNDSLIGYFILIVLTFFLPDIYNIQLYSFMLPFFILAYLYNKNKILINSYLRNQKLLVGVLLLIYLFLFYFYNHNTYIYTSGFSVLGKKDVFLQLITNLHRFLIGFIGCILAVILSKSLFNRSFSKSVVCLSQLGINSLGIYIISGYFFEYILQKITPFFVFNYIYHILETVFILLITNLIILVIKKNNILSLVLLGGR